MKYADFKKALDEYFLPDDEIFPHASGGVVTFYHIYHGQSCVTIEKSENGVISGLTVIAVHPTGKPLEGDIEQAAEKITFLSASKKKETKNVPESIAKWAGVQLADVIFPARNNVEI